MFLWLPEAQITNHLIFPNSRGETPSLRSYVKLENIEFSDSSATELMAEVSEDESVREFREYLKTLSSDLHFPALESLLTLKNFSPENVIEFCSDLGSKYV